MFAGSAHVGCVLQIGHYLFAHAGITDGTLQLMSETGLRPDGMKKNFWRSWPHKVPRWSRGCRTFCSSPTEVTLGDAFNDANVPHRRQWFSCPPNHAVLHSGRCRTACVERWTVGRQSPNAWPR